MGSCSSFCCILLITVPYCWVMTMVMSVWPLRELWIIISSTWGSGRVSSAGPGCCMIPHDPFGVCEAAKMRIICGISECQAFSNDFV